MNRIKTYVKILIVISIYAVGVCATSISVYTLKYTSLVIAPERMLSTVVLEKTLENTIIIPDVLVDKKEMNIPKNTPLPKPLPAKKPVATSVPTPTQNPVIENFMGSLSGYGPDCIGCTSNKTASGYHIGEGNIYYQDKIYGTIRIVSGDKKYPFGTIVRIKNTNFFENDIIAIVLDRGGSVGIGKFVQFDLLFTSENETKSFGLKKNVEFDILRLGY